MNTLFKTLALASLLGAAACGGDDAPSNPDAPEQQIDAAVDAPPGPPTYRQVEFLARPGIAEALLLSDAFLAGYNATAPSFAGVDPATLGMVAGEVKTVLKAVFHGVCLVNGALGAAPADGFKPAGVQCGKTADLFTNGSVLTGTILDPAQVTAANTYADKVFSQFVPDVLRIDTSTESGYVHNGTALTLCGDTSSTPLLCGGRKLTEDVIDLTYDYLFAGAGVTLAANPPAQFRALVSDGVSYDAGGAGSQNLWNITAPNAANSNQFHPPTTSTFPYSAPPI